ncbi:37S ribosomal protein MRP4, mitochondrial [Erysiphe necator]|nr:37S ribosomal protein MRP4, mitochondrial [Erysiphe necator]
MPVKIVAQRGRSALLKPVSRCCVRLLSSEHSAINPSLSYECTSGSSPPEAMSSPTSEILNEAPSIINRWIPANMKRKGPSDYIVLKTNAIKATIQRTTAKLGATPELRYHPKQTLWNPPKPEDVTLEMLMAAQTHFGHHSSLWNPMNQRYIYGIRHGIHIFSLETIAAHLRRAAKVVEDVCYRGGIVLFVGTKKGHAAALVRAAQLAKSYFLFERWQPGTITNGDQILKMCRIKAVDPLDKEIEGFEDKLETWSALKPDLVVCLNPMENYIMLHECRSNNIPTIGVIDTNADPTWVTYTIPGNDDSLRASQLIAGVLGRAGEAGQSRRLADAKNGLITWKTNPRLGNPKAMGAET